jgi:imidazolonepropionase-like amidohydrolase
LKIYTNFQYACFQALSAAGAVGMAVDIGVLATGRLTDVIGVAGNPLQDLRTLLRVTFVMKEGKVVKRD